MNQPFKDQRVMIRLDINQRRALERAAERQRRPLSQLVRIIALDWLANEQRRQARGVRL